MDESATALWWRMAEEEPAEERGGGGCARADSSRRLGDGAGAERLVACVQLVCREVQAEVQRYRAESSRAESSRAEAAREGLEPGSRGVFSRYNVRRPSRCVVR